MNPFEINVGDRVSFWDYVGKGDFIKKEATVIKRRKTRNDQSSMYRIETDTGEKYDKPFHKLTKIW